MSSETIFSPQVFMGYLVRIRKATVAHYWMGTDTACSMASTGGLDVGRYTILKDTSLPVCQMCLSTAIAESVARVT